MSRQGADNRIEASLRQRIAAGHRLVWWSDPDAEFLESISELLLNGAQLVDVAATPALALKRRVELDAPPTSFVLYAPAPAPELAQATDCDTPVARRDAIDRLNVWVPRRVNPTVTAGVTTFPPLRSSHPCSMPNACWISWSTVVPSAVSPVVWPAAPSPAR